MKQRKGFTLIELMIVIAIIIILAAIAIPNYLRMTDRAKRSRVAGDFESIATALEAFQVDWGTYPIDATAEQFGKVKTGANIILELTGTGTTGKNIASNTTLTGEPGGIDYIKLGTLAAMYNPFDPGAGYYYASDDAGSHWALAVQYNSTDLLYRSDMETDLTQAAGTASGLTIDGTGKVTP